MANRLRFNSTALRRLPAVLVVFLGAGLPGALPSETPKAERIEAAVRRTATSAADMARPRVDVDVERGTVRLTGSVEMLRDAWRLRDAVARLRGVDEVIDDLRVDSAGRSDRDIRREIEWKLEGALPVRSQNLTVRVDGGRVTLSGLLEDGRTRFVVRDVAAGTRGVISVDDRLTTPDMPDALILIAARGVLGRNSLYGPSGDLGISVEDGIVRLSGAVPRLIDRYTAETLVRGIDGVRDVVDELTILSG